MLKFAFHKTTSIILAIGLSSATSFANFEIPGDADVLDRIGTTATEQTIPHQFGIVVWNLHKGRTDGWDTDLKTLSRDKQVSVLQEIWMNDSMKSSFAAISGWLWDFAEAFNYKKDGTGVMTGSYVNPTAVLWSRSAGREPLIQTPKMTMITKYKTVSGNSPLVVLNIHGLNKTADSKMIGQVKTDLDLVNAEQGPIIFAGDFNTLSQTRLTQLQALMKKYGYSQAPLKHRRDPPLDHIFYRNVKWVRGQVREDITTSDHQPIEGYFELNN